MQPIYLRESQPLGRCDLLVLGIISHYPDPIDTGVDLAEKNGILIDRPLAGADVGSSYDLRSSL
jgi:hypothetical protein